MAKLMLVERLGVWLNAAGFLSDVRNPFSACLRAHDGFKTLEIRGDGHCQLRFVDS